MLRSIAVAAALLLATASAAQAQSAPPKAAAAAAPARSAAGLAANQFASEQAAKSHCPADTVVWTNLGGSKAYHASGDRFFGKTRQGAYMCRKDADQAGFHPAGQRGGRSATKAAPAQTTK
ncbi:MAG TPA: hypothetical protein VGF07_11340 [Stellaceae bacterium]